MTSPIPPPPPRTNYVLYGVIGALVGLAIVVLILVFTGGDDPEAAPTTTQVTAPTTETTEATTTTTAETTTSTTSAATTTAGTSFAGTTDSKVAEGPLFDTFAFFSDIRFAQRAEGFTRVVFDFEGTDVPWWSVAYVPGPFTNPGDEPIPISGSAFLEVVLSSTSFDLTGEEVRITYPGPDRVPVNTTSVVEVVRVEDFEGISNWVIGVTGEKPFLVGTLTDPPRVFIDIQD